MTAPTPALRTIVSAMRDVAAETAERTGNPYYLGREDGLAEVLDVLDKLGASS